MARVPEHGPVGAAVAGVADQLLVPDLRGRPLGRARGEDGDGRPHPSLVGGLAQVGEGLGGDLLGGGDVAAVSA
jgi:hypothetical protein